MIFKLALQNFCKTIKKFTRSHDLLPLLLILLILGAYVPFYWHGGFLGDFGDPIGQTIPNKFLLVQYLKNGFLPLWNPFSFLGFPMLADIQVGTFYLPDIVFFWLFSPLQAHNISVLFHLVLGGLGAYFLLKKMSGSRLTALALALTLATAGSFLTRIVYLNFLETIVYIPWILLMAFPCGQISDANIEKIVSTRFEESKGNFSNKLSFTLTVLLISLMIFAGHPIALFYSFIIIAVFIGINLPRQWKKMLFAFVIAFMIAGIQIIPFLSLKSLSVRDSLSYQQFTEGSLQWDQLWNFFIPSRQGLANPFDDYIHFGTIAAFLFLLSFFFYRKFKPSQKKIFIAGIVLFILGIFFSLGGTFPLLAKILFHLPIFSLMRVPERYIVIAHFGILFALVPFLSYFFVNEEKKKLQKSFISKKVLGIVFHIALIVNALIIPSIFLVRHELYDAQKEYLPSAQILSEKIQSYSDTVGASQTLFSLTSVPHYFLSSSLILFPNRHILNFMPNIIGYNPLVLKNFYEALPVGAGGSFQNPNYFIDYYPVFEKIGLSYYLFPTANFLQQHHLSSKQEVLDFLQTNGWQKISGDQDFDIWKNPHPKAFASFNDPANRIDSIDFEPGKIQLLVSVTKDDTLTVNQIAIDGWKIQKDNGPSQYAPPFQDHLVQSYKIPAGTQKITLSYEPHYLLYGIVVTSIGFLALLLCLFFGKKIRK